MTAEEELRVLKMVQDGIISAVEADRLLQSLGAGSAAPAPVVDSAPPALLPSVGRYPLIAGCLLVGIGAVALAADYAGAGGVRALEYLALGLGLAVTLAGLYLVRATWFRIHVSERKRGESLHMAIPIPLTLAAWAVRMARPYVHRFDMTGLDEVILALRDGARRGERFSVDVAEREDGERIQVSIG